MQYPILEILNHCFFSEKCLFVVVVFWSVCILYMPEMTFCLALYQKGFYSEISERFLSLAASGNRDGLFNPGFIYDEKQVQRVIIRHPGNGSCNQQKRRCWNGAPFGESLQKRTKCPARWQTITMYRPDTFLSYHIQAGVA